MSTIRNPVEWTFAQVRDASAVVGSTARAIGHIPDDVRAARPVVRRIAVADLGEVFRAGFQDFTASRADVVLLCVIYPVVGLILGRLVFGGGMLPLLFPLASGFALVGPFACIGLYEMSRQREQGGEVNWAHAFDVFRSPAAGAVGGLGSLLVAVFLLWLIAAAVIFNLTLGPQPPASLALFAHDVLTTQAGWAMTVIGIGVGFLFAVVAMAISVVSFPLLLDRHVSLGTAIWTSVRAVAANPAPMAAWGAIVAAALLAGSVPALLGLVVVMPVLGHATWHLYRKLIPR
ncbi:MAG TPA: DUF2189 domain-containing protein [Candidatus Sulfotelmatobacter sp.]|nr:DUF2189 domain-containing protein [Candidatus Sulfotelmatobacter sp.]